MAIQVSGTEVISNSRVLSNVTGLKTINSTSILGSGDIAVGASYDINGVGSYTVAMDTTQSTTEGTGYKQGRTAAGSNLESRGISGGGSNISAGTATSTTGTSGLTASHNTGYQSLVHFRDNQTFSGSWRLMTPSMKFATQGSDNWGVGFPGLWVRYA